MALRVVGAGLGRTGTHSLMTALELLLDGPCYHMAKVFERPDDAEKWLRIGRGETELLEDVMEGSVAAVDWPAAAYWQPLAAMNPHAIILLSTRSSGEAWFKSATDTIFPTIEQVPDGVWKDMVNEMLQDFAGGDLTDKDEVIAAYNAHNNFVRANADPNRLVDWQPGDGWGPICAALDLPIPDEPFPHTNSTEEFLGRRQLAD